MTIILRVIEGARIFVFVAGLTFLFRTPRVVISPPLEAIIMPTQPTFQDNIMSSLDLVVWI